MTIIACTWHEHARVPNPQRQQALPDTATDTGAHGPGLAAPGPVPDASGPGADLVWPGTCMYPGPCGALDPGKTRDGPGHEYARQYPGTACPGSL